MASWTRRSETCITGMVLSLLSYFHYDDARLDTTSHRTGEVINPVFTRFAFPPRWHYDVLRGLDYFRAVDAPHDESLGDAIELVRKSRGEDGRWTLQNTYAGKTWFELERRGAPSRWNTLRALRVLAWWGDEGKRLRKRVTSA